MGLFELFKNPPKQERSDYAVSSQLRENPDDETTLDNTTAKLNSRVKIASATRAGF